MTSFAGVYIPMLIPNCDFIYIYIHISLIILYLIFYLSFFILFITLFFEESHLCWFYRESHLAYRERKKYNITPVEMRLSLRFVKWLVENMVRPNVSHFRERNMPFIIDSCWNFLLIKDKQFLGRIYETKVTSFF